MEIDSYIVTSEVRPLRKRGGQPGNTNALKHGFYSRRFRRIEVQDLVTALSPGLMDEIAMLRVVMRRVFDHASEADIDLVAWSDALNILGVASTRLARLLRTQKDLGQTDGVSDLLAQAVTRVLKEKNYP
jgi:hypothetical protein